jgi:hypothetical protein
VLKIKLFIEGEASLEWPAKSPDFKFFMFSPLWLLHDNVISKTSRQPTECIIEPLLAE